jgi:serine/threonine-protein kinase SRPK3
MSSQGPYGPYSMRDDITLNYSSNLVHALATPQGTFLRGLNKGLEPLEEYQEGGYYPVYIRDILS